jgi:hypothetical protein
LRREKSDFTKDFSGTSIARELECAIVLGISHERNQLIRTSFWQMVLGADARFVGIGFRRYSEQSRISLFTISFLEAGKETDRQRNLRQTDLRG